MAFYCPRKRYLNFDYLGTLDSNGASTRWMHQKHTRKDLNFDFRVCYGAVCRFMSCQKINVKSNVIQNV